MKILVNLIIRLPAVNTELHLAIGIDLNVQKKVVSDSTDLSTVFYLYSNQKDTVEQEKNYKDIGPASDHYYRISTIEFASQQYHRVTMEVTIDK